MKGNFGPAAFCAQQCLELLLKATLIYWDKSFDPKKAGHKYEPMLDAIENKVPNGRQVQIQPYFFAGGRYQSASRYPGKDFGILIPVEFLDDLDSAFHDLLKLVPFHFNSILVNTLASQKKPDLHILTRSNRNIRSVRKFLMPWMERVLGSRYRAYLRNKT